MKLYEEPVDGYENKSVITGDRAYFIPYLRKTDAPTMIEILTEIFDLDDPGIFTEVDDKLDEGKIFLSHYALSTKEIIVHLPLETSGYVRIRTEEVFGGV